MQKRNLQHAWTQKLIAVGLSAAMIVPSLSSLGTIAAQAEETLPVPVGSYEADVTVDTNTEDVDPTVVDADDLWAGAKAWSLGDTIAAEADADGITTNSDSAISVTNPLLNNEDILEDVTTGEDGYLEWNTAVTVTYWVKCASGENNLSSLISFKSEDVLTTHKDSLQKYDVYTALSNYKEGDENDPTSEFYCKVSDKKVTKGSNEYTVYDFYAYAQAKGVENLNSIDAIPELVIYSPNYEGVGYVYFGAHDENGEPTEDFVLNTNCIAITTFLSTTTKADIAETLESYKDFAVLNQGEVRYGYENSLLQLTTNDSLVFTQDTNECKLYKDGVGDGSGGAQPKNSLYYTPGSSQVKAPDDDTEWHYVAFVIKNDAQYVYVDSELVCEDLTDAFTDESGQALYYDNKSFNLGTGLLNNSQKGRTTLTADWKYDPNANAPTILEWLSTAETLNIGGASIGVSSTWVSYVTGTVAGTQIASVKVYDFELDADEVAALYEAKGDAPETEAPETEAPETEAPETETPETSAPETETYFYGDVNKNGKVEAVDALEVLKHVVKLSVIEEGSLEWNLADMDGDKELGADDALQILKTVVKLLDEKEYVATPATEAPETSAPETEAPETEAPETEAPETEAPETEAPETEAPEPTKSPEELAEEDNAWLAEALAAHDESINIVENISDGSVVDSAKIAGLAGEYFKAAVLAADLSEDGSKTAWGYPASTAPGSGLYGQISIDELGDMTVKNGALKVTAVKDGTVTIYAYLNTTLNEGQTKELTVYNETADEVLDPLELSESYANAIFEIAVSEGDVLIIGGDNTTTINIKGIGFDATE